MYHYLVGISKRWYSSTPILFEIAQLLYFHNEKEEREHIILPLFALDLDDRSPLEVVFISLDS